MVTSYSESELMDFLDYLSSKGLLGSSTASGRKAAALKILSALDPAEKTDLRNIDRDQTFQRFSNKFGKEFTPDSLTTYKSRFNAALNDFFKYQENPSGFKVNSSKRVGKETGVEKSTKGKTPPTRQKPPQTDFTDKPKGVTFPIPIRDNVIIEIHNLPMDLSKAEATRISAVIMALSTA